MILHTFFFFFLVLILNFIIQRNLYISLSDIFKIQSDSYQVLTSILEESEECNDTSGYSFPFWAIYYVFEY